MPENIRDTDAKVPLMEAEQMYVTQVKPMYEAPKAPADEIELQMALHNHIDTGLV